MGLAPPAAAGIARGVLKSLFLAHSRTVAIKATVGITIGVGLFLLGSAAAARAASTAHTDGAGPAEGRRPG
jgi:hypothetical protein